MRKQKRSTARALTLVSQPFEQDPPNGAALNGSIGMARNEQRVGQRRGGESTRAGRRREDSEDLARSATIAGRAAAATLAALGRDYSAEPDRAAGRNDVAEAGDRNEHPVREASASSGG
jgi:hypothetical protein